ncbi:multicopper oxidase family protein [Myxococcaceae bacterium GXIMD 01537]
MTTSRWRKSLPLGLGGLLILLAVGTPAEKGFSQYGCGQEPPPAEGELRLPDEVRSVDGELDVTLRVAYADNTLGTAPVHLRNYNGKLVGPTLRVKPGDVLNVRLLNELPAEPDSGGHGGHDAANPNIPHGFNTTNLHTHGLHVSPAGNSDNVLIEVPPGHDFPYEIKVPRDHPPGTFWYHGHKHGSVSIQLASGMAGMLIIEGGLDDVPEIRRAREQLFVFQQIPYDDQGLVEDFTKAFAAGAWEASGRATTINGQVRPTLVLRPGEVQRWRMVHAGTRATLRVGLVRARPVGAQAEFAARELATLTQGELPLHEIALDGIALGRIDRLSRVTLQPGYRSDVLVKLDEPGRYQLVDLPEQQSTGLLVEAESGKVLAEIEVRGSRKNMQLPPASALAPLAPFAPIRDSELSGCQQVSFNLASGTFTIDDKAFDPHDTPRALTLGAAQEWLLTSRRGNHPFHIHVNPFETEDTEDTVDGKPRRVWRDTVLVRSNNPNGVRIRSRYTRYIGRFVLHCHILDHEDRGMMQLVEISPGHVMRTGLGCPGASSLQLADDAALLAPEQHTYSETP